MGRWAQRTRQGGSVNAFSQMQLAVPTSGNPDSLDLTYNGSANLALLAAADFTSNPSGETGNFQVVTGAHTISVQFTGDVSGDDTVTYSGNAVGFVTPDTRAIT